MIETSGSSIQMNLWDTDNSTYLQELEDSHWDSNGPIFQVISVSSQADFPVKTSVSPIQTLQDSQVSVQDYGMNTPELFAMLDPNGLLLKMSGIYCQLTTEGTLQLYLETWPRAGMMLNGKFYRLKPLVPHILEKEYLFWRTPSTSDAKGGPKSAQNYQNSMKTRKHAINLVDQVKHSNPMIFWPTPTVNDAKNNGSPSRFRRNSLPLDAMVKNYPTPQATDWKRDGKPHGMGQIGLPEVIGGKLNPTFVEWLMGYPIGWTELRD